MGRKTHWWSFVCFLTFFILSVSGGRHGHGREDEYYPGAYPDIVDQHALYVFDVSFSEHDLHGSEWDHINCPELVQHSGPNYQCFYDYGFEPLMNNFINNQRGGLLIVSAGDDACFTLVCRSTVGHTYTIGNSSSNVPIEFDGLFNLMSLNKLPYQLLITHYISSGVLSPSDRIVDIWPYFGRDRNGQSTGYGSATLQDFLSYKAAHSVLGRELSMDDVRNGARLQGYPKLRESIMAIAPTTTSYGLSPGRNPLDAAQYPYGNGVRIGVDPAYAPVSGQVFDDFLISYVDPFHRTGAEVLQSSGWAYRLEKIMNRPGDNFPVRGIKHEFYAHGIGQKSLLRRRMYFPQEAQNPTMGFTEGDLQYYGTIQSDCVADPVVGLDWVCYNSSSSSIRGAQPQHAVETLALLRPQGFGALPNFGMCGITDVYGLGGAHHSNAKTLWAYAAQLTYYGGVPGSFTRLVSRSAVKKQMEYATNGTQVDGYFHIPCRAYAKGLGYKRPLNRDDGCGLHNMTASAVYGCGTYDACFYSNPDSKLTMVTVPQYYYKYKTPDHVVAVFNEDLFNLAEQAVVDWRELS